MFKVLILICAVTVDRGRLHAGYGHRRRARSARAFPVAMHPREPDDPRPDVARAGRGQAILEGGVRLRSELVTASSFAGRRRLRSLRLPPALTRRRAPRHTTRSLAARGPTAVGIATILSRRTVLVLERSSAIGSRSIATRCATALRVRRLASRLMLRTTRFALLRRRQRRVGVATIFRGDRSGGSASRSSAGRRALRHRKARSPAPRPPLARCGQSGGRRIQGCSAGRNSRHGSRLRHRCRAPRYQWRSGSSSGRS